MPRKCNKTMRHPGAATEAQHLLETATWTTETRSMRDDACQKALESLSVEDRAAVMRAIETFCYIPGLGMQGALELVLHLGVHMIGKRVERRF